MSIELMILPNRNKFRSYFILGSTSNISCQTKNEIRQGLNCQLIIMKMNLSCQRMYESFSDLKAWRELEKMSQSDFRDYREATDCCHRYQVAADQRLQGQSCQDSTRGCQDQQKAGTQGPR